MAKIGKCSICGKEAKLSYDHVPPKCCGNNKDSHYISFTPKYLGNKMEMAKQKHSQNGIKFQTICNDCNNILGGKFDKELECFKKFFIDAVNGNKSSGGFDLKKVIKGLVGHLLATTEFDSYTSSKALRDYYFDRNDKLLTNYSLCVYYYPYQNSIFILRDYVIINLCSNNDVPKGILSSLYFFPFAFILCEKKKCTLKNDLFEALKTPMLLTFHTDDWIGKQPYWPALIDDSHILIASRLGENSVLKLK